MPNAPDCNVRRSREYAASASRKNTVGRRRDAYFRQAEAQVTAVVLLQRRTTLRIYYAVWSFAGRPAPLVRDG